MRAAGLEPDRRGPGGVPRPRENGRIRAWSLLSALMIAALVAAAPAGADLQDEIALAERYAPVVRLVEQPEECGPGEPYEPLDVDALFDEPTVALRGPVGRRRPRRDRPDRRRPRRRPLRVPPRLPRRRARSRLHLRALGAAPRPRAERRRSTRTSSATPAIRASSRSSTGSSTPTTTGTTCTRATGR